jgi:hypothetical protein
LQYDSAHLFLRRQGRNGFTMSRQLTVASAFAVFALSALALFAPGSARLSEIAKTGATSGIAAPALTAELPFFD